MLLYSIPSINEIYSPRIPADSAIGGTMAGKERRVFVEHLTHSGERAIKNINKRKYKDAKAIERPSTLFVVN